MTPLDHRGSYDDCPACEMEATARTRRNRVELVRAFFTVVAVAVLLGAIVWAIAESVIEESRCAGECDGDLVVQCERDHAICAGRGDDGSLELVRWGR
jgi:hypothetical protein